MHYSRTRTGLTRIAGRCWPEGPAQPRLGHQLSSFWLPLPGVEPHLPVSVRLSLGALPLHAKAPPILMKRLPAGVPAQLQVLGRGSAPPPRSRAEGREGAVPVAHGRYGELQASM